MTLTMSGEARTGAAESLEAFGLAGLYRQRLTTARAAMERIRSGQRVFVMGNAGMPKALLAAFVERARELRDVEVLHVLTVDHAEYVDPALAGHLRVNSQFVGANVRPAIQEGRADFTPVFLSEVPRLYRTALRPDVALIQVSPPDAHGFCSFGVEVGVSKPAAEAAATVIAQVNPQMPRTLGDSFIHLSRLDAIVEADEPLDEVPMAVGGETEARIAGHVVGLIEDGATLQLGIGGLPNRVLSALGGAGVRDLGIHTELFSDGVIDLVERGIITNARKTLHPGKIIAGFVLGSQRLYRFIHDNAAIEFHPSDYVNDPWVIAQNERMVAINSALEVDLTGQVCADSIGHRIYSGAGGQVDFVRGAARSNGGRPLIALPSTARGGAVSRIVFELRPGAGVVTSRNDVHTVVTEYGVAELYGKTIRQRAQALIAIAHPAFRDELLAQARAAKYL
ncbi:MAG TPA: acetyl-CoA hydrolase/transferase C-terminal domain-containing protein [Herpetosiphonaceae bacterium]